MVSYITGVSASTSSQAGHFTDNASNPKLWVATETWGLIVNAGAWTAGGSPTDWETEMSNFISARSAQGFNVIMVDPIWTESANTESSGGNTWDGVTPFTGGVTDPTGATLNSSFWTRVDYLISTAASYGMTIGLVLFNTNNTTLGATWTDAQRQSWGNLIGSRYASTPNLVWLLGNDAWPSGDDSTWPSILTGLAAAGDSHLTIAWYEAEYTSRYETDNNEEAAWGAAHSAADFCYTYNCSYWVIEYAFGEVANQGQADLLPVIQGDGYFYAGGQTGVYASAFDRFQRQFWWWALAAGSRGVMGESEEVYPWTASTCVTAVTAEWFFVHNAANIIAFFTGLYGWHLLLPDLTSSLVTAGRGTRATGYTAGGSGGTYTGFTNSWVSASVTPDGKTAICYLPNATTITVATGSLASGWVASWVDPITCATSSAGSGPTFNSTAKGNNSQGDPDWVLVFQAPTSSNSGPNYAAAEGTGTGGQGSWVNPADAEGAPDGVFATWVVP